MVSIAFDIRLDVQDRRRRVTVIGRQFRLRSALSGRRSLGRSRLHLGHDPSEARHGPELNAIISCPCLDCEHGCLCMPVP